jgi:hypothetical protein
MSGRDPSCNTGVSSSCERDCMLKLNTDRVVSSSVTVLLKFSVLIEVLVVHEKVDIKVTHKV